MEQPDQKLDDEGRRRLEERPRSTLRLRIALVFITFVLFITAITVGSMLMLSRFRAKMQFLEAADECAFEIQEARRYEKNFLLYGTSLYDALDHTYRVQRLIEENRSDMEEVVGVETAQNWLQNIEHYEQLLEHLAGSTSGDRLEEAARRQEEASLRRYGAAILADASDMIAKERQSMNSMIQTAMWSGGASLGFMVLLMFILSYQLEVGVPRSQSR